jgi:ring-1,2-phenylacetyl-CoA epoxidase subunit PaaD
MIIEETIEAKIWEALREVQDPEIPVLSLVDLGMISQIDCDKSNKVKVFMTPTFTGCPAINIMKTMIVMKLAEHGFEETEVIIDTENTWNTDKISEEGKQKLIKFGIAAPHKKSCMVEMSDLLDVPCPHCGSSSTTLRSPFGSTLCRAMHYCNSCRQSFEQFKPL